MTAADTLVAGRYRVSAYLGAGGMGRVWLARDEVLRRDVAIKEIALPFGLTDEEREEMRERTLREAQAAGRLSHPNVIRIYDVHHGQERPWIVMEYVPSRSLLDIIKAHGPLPAEQVAGIGLAVLSALNAANQVGVLHRDVKPSNVLIANDGRVVLTDFGSAMIDEGEGALTRTGVILGSPRYIAPERARDGVATPESDLWSLGATLYEAVEGRAPYTRETTLETLIALATEKPDPVRLAGPLKPVLTGLLQKDPKDRMKPKEVDARLRQIADVQSLVRLREVPAAQRPADLADVMRFGGPWTPDAAVTPQEGVYIDHEALALPPMPANSAELRTTPAWAEPRPAPRSGRSKGRRPQLIATGALAAAVVALGAIVFVVTDNDDAKSPTSAAAQPSAGPASVAPTASPSAASVASNVLPGGFRWYQSKSGFRTAYPAGWTNLKNLETRSSVTFCHPGGPPLLTVREWQPSDPDLSLALAREETAAVPTMPSYRRIRMDVSPQQDSGLWEYMFTDPDPKMGKLRGIDQIFVAAGRTYIIQWRTPADQWDQYIDDLGVVLRNFRPVATPKSTALPSAFTWYTSPSGFRVAAPARWTKLEDKPTSVRFSAPGGAPLLGVRVWQPSNSDLSVAFSDIERTWRQQVRNYRRVSMDLLQDQTGAVWEYTYTDPQTGRRMHGLDRAFVESGKTYVIEWRTAAGQWTANLANLGVVAASFRAQGGA